MSALGGWWRIWIVLTGLLLVVGTVGGLQQRQFDNELVGKSSCFPGTIETKIVSQPTVDAWTAVQKTLPETLEQGKIIGPRVDVEQFSCVSWFSMLRAWALALAAALAVLVIIYVARWIVAGFNRSEK